MTAINQLSVALARFPFTNQIDYKIRPALIISNNRFNGANRFFWVVPITSQNTPSEFEIEVPAAEFSGEFKTKSFIRTDKIATMEKEMLLKEIGKITPTLFEKVKIAINKNL
ncbi:MAG: type II toxin-antitoxin system PemK/MazF family toxin [Candidatus Micrarchaeota archaeon]